MKLRDLCLYNLGRDAPSAFRRATRHGHDGSLPPQQQPGAKQRKPPTTNYITCCNCIGVDVGANIVKKAKNRHQDACFAVAGDARKAENGRVSADSKAIS